LGLIYPSTLKPNRFKSGYLEINLLPPLYPSSVVQCFYTDPASAHMRSGAMFLHEGLWLAFPIIKPQHESQSIFKYGIPEKKTSHLKSLWSAANPL
jgi:hypothetical protein